MDNPSLHLSIREQTTLIQSDSAAVLPVALKIIPRHETGCTEGQLLAGLDYRHQHYARGIDVTLQNPLTVGKGQSLGWASYRSQAASRVGGRFLHQSIASVQLGRIKGNSSLAVSPSD